MESHIYELARAAEKDHWWFRGRRAVLRSVLRDRIVGRPGGSSILEVGCGNGGNLPLLREFGEVWGVEADATACRNASARGVATVEQGALPDRLPLNGRRFDVVALLDVLEHIDAEQEAIRALRQQLSPTGSLLVTVPAYPWLWSRHDDLSHHARRYTRRSLAAALTSGGYVIDYITYFNAALFPLALARTVIEKAAPWSDPLAPITVPPRPINETFAAIFGMERFFIPRVALPFGVSLLAIARPRPS